MMQQSKMLTEKEKNTCPMVETAECVRFLERLPYKLTGAQNKVIGEILADMTGDAVMSRLVQGDVGSGKTIVAFWALLLCVTNGYQGALMALRKCWQGSITKRFYGSLRNRTCPLYRCFCPAP